MSPFRSFHEYEEFIYTLQQRFPSITRSTLVMSLRGRGVAIVQGELCFAHEYRIVVRERLTCDAETVVIGSYGYEVWQGSMKIAWYDSQPHPDDPLLVSTHPHHKHVPPDIKHNRVPAPNINFTCPNLSALIQEVEDLIEDEKHHATDRNR
jgi:hypothetical protein